MERPEHRPLTFLEWQQRWLKSAVSIFACISVWPNGRERGKGVLTCCSSEGVPSGNNAPMTMPALGRPAGVKPDASPCHRASEPTGSDKKSSPLPRANGLSAKKPEGIGAVVATAIWGSSKAPVSPERKSAFDFVLAGKYAASAHSLMTVTQAAMAAAESKIPRARITALKAVGRAWPRLNSTKSSSM